MRSLLVVLCVVGSGLAAVLPVKPNIGHEYHYVQQPSTVKYIQPAVKYLQPSVKYVEPTRYYQPETHYYQPSVKYVQPTTQYYQQPSVKYVQPSVKYVEPSVKYVEPSVKYVQPSIKHVQHSVKGVDHVIPIAIVRSNSEFSYDGTFASEYETENGIKSEARGMVKNFGTKEAANVMQGSYSYTAPDGTPITTTWFADENGFHAEGDHLPVAPPIPEAIARSLEYIRSLPPSKEGSYEQELPSVISN